MSEVLILGEVKEGALNTRTLELLGAGKKLAGETGGDFSLLLMGDGISGAADQALTYGAARVYKVGASPAAGFSGRSVAQGPGTGLRRDQTENPSHEPRLHREWSWVRDWPAA